MHKFAAPLAIALLIATGGYSAFAQSEASVEAAAVGSVAVTLADAVASVEAKNTGKVVEAALVTEGAASVYLITALQTDGTETNYAVDAMTGAVVVTVDMQGEGHDGGDQGHEGRDEGPNGDGDGETQDSAN